MKFKKYLFLSAILILCACANNSISSLNTSFSKETSNDLSNYSSDNSSNLINNSLSSIDNTSSSIIKNSSSINNSTSTSNTSSIISNKDENIYNPDGSKLLPLPTTKLEEVWNEKETLYNFQTSFPNGFNYIHGHQIVKTPKFYDNDEKGWKITFPNTGARLGLQTPFFVSNLKLEIRLYFTGIFNNNDKVDEDHPWITVYGFNNDRKIVQTKYVECPKNFYNLQNNSQPFNFYMSGEDVTYLEIRFTAPPYKTSQCYNFGIKQIGFKSFPYKYNE